MHTPESERSRRVQPLLVLALVTALAGGALGARAPQAPAQPPAPSLTLTPAVSSNIYKVGDKIAWQVTAADASLASVSYTLQRNGLTTYKTDTLALTGGKGTIETSLDAPGAVLLTARPVVPAPPTPPAAGGAPGVGRAGAGGRGGVMAGALVSPEKIQPSSPRPKDFDQWWAAKVKQLHAVPMNAHLTPKDGGNPKVDYALITMDNIKGVHVQGQFARPKASGKHPALVILQWAGVYSLPASRVVDRAAEGWLALNIEPHDMPSDQPNEFYTNLSTTTLRNYQAIGQEDRETSYFLQMYLSAYRAIDYIAAQPDWDGKTLVVQGTSMGGQQSISMAGLHPKVSALIVMVPSSNDVTAPLHDRAAGFPDWARDASTKTNPKILDAAQYFDPMNFAYKIKVPALVAMGLYDTTSPPAGVWSAINQMHGRVEPLPMVSGHQDVANSQGPYKVRQGEWLNLLLKGTDPAKAPK